MDVPIPILVLAALALAALAWLALRRRGNRDLLAPPPHLRASTPDGPEIPIDQDVLALVRAGNKIAAIKALREATGLGLAEAKEMVEAVERGEVADLPRASVPPTPGDLDSELRALLAAGRKIEAVKRAREVLGLGLAEAKDHVERLESASG